MNTDKSKYFTNEEKAKKIAKRRGQSTYNVGKNSKGQTVYYVGKYEDALVASKSYDQGYYYRDKRLPKLK